MKKGTIIGFLVSLAVLAGMLGWLHQYAATLELDLEEPEIISMTYEDGKATITWSAVEFSTSYRVYEKKDDGGWKLVKPVAADVRSYTFDGFGTYAVRACNVSNEKTTLSEYSTAEFVVKTPEIISVVEEDGTATLTWTPVDFITSYRVYIRTSNGGWSLVDPVPAKMNAYTVDKPGEYAIRACNVSGETTVLSSYSASVKVMGE